MNKFGVFVAFLIGDGEAGGVHDAQVALAGLDPQDRHDGDVHLFGLLVGGHEAVLEDDVSGVSARKEVGVSFVLNKCIDVKTTTKCL